MAGIAEIAATTGIKSAIRHESVSATSGPTPSVVAINATLTTRFSSAIAVA